MRPGTRFIHGSGELLPLYPCVGSSITDGEISHALNFGKKLHLPADKTKHKIYVAGPRTFYAVWLFRTEKDFAPFRKAIADSKTVVNIETAGDNEAATST